VENTNKFRDVKSYSQYNLHHYNIGGGKMEKIALYKDLKSKTFG